MKLKFEYRITILYLLLGALWIIFSDRLLTSFTNDPGLLTTLQTFKGWFYVLITGVLLYVLLKHHLRQIRASNSALLERNQMLKEKHDEYYSLFEEYKTQNEELKLTKEKAIDNEEQFKQLIDNAPDAVHIQANQKIIYVNNKLLELLGASKKEDLLEKSVFDFIHPAEIEAVKRALVSFQNKEDLSLLRLRYLRLDKTEVEIELSVVETRFEGKIAALVFSRDISEEKKYLLELERKNRFIETVLDRLPIGLALNRFNEGDATYMNEKFVEIYGWPREELVNIESFFQKVYPDRQYRDKIMKMIQADIVAGKPENMHWENITITQKSGEERIVNAVNIPIPEQNTMVSTVIDVTDLKRTEYQLLAAKEKAEESERLKTAFLNNISHEFRTPMNGIIGFLDLLLKPRLSETRRKKYIEIIKESSNQLLDIVTDTVEVSQIQSNNIKVSINAFSLKNLLEDIARNYEMPIAKKALDFKLNIYCEKGQEIVRTDRHKIFRIIKHLVDNAVKFTSKGGITVTCMRENGKVKFEVIDTGIGISPEASDIIFESFRQTETGYHRNFGGNGIGLFIAKAYTEKLNGEITFSSEPGKGSAFEVVVPVI